VTLFAQNKDRIREKALLLFEDLSSVELSPRITKGYFPRGYQQKIRTSGQNPTRRIFGAINPFAEDHNQKSFYYMFGKTRNSQDFIAFVDYLLTEEPDRALFFVLDNASIHNSKATNEYLAPLEEEGRVERLFLPTYAPKYNWIESIWLHSKRHVMDNAGFDSLEEILNTLSHFWESLSPDDYRRFMGVKTRLEKPNVQLLI